MKMSYFKVVLFIAVGVLLISCATPKAVSTFNTVNLNPLLQRGDYLQKVDNFVVILDKSGSMDESYKGRKKLDYAKDLVSWMNQTLPNLQTIGALRSFGRVAFFSEEFTQLLWGPETYSRTGLDGGLNKVGRGRGDSPLSLALDASDRELKSLQGNIAVIIFSDANKEYMNYDAALDAARTLRSRYGNRLCIYTVQIGKDPEGKKLLQRLTREGECGFWVNADDIASSQGMANFVQKVFLEKAPPKLVVIEEVVVKEEIVILDSDGDGVPDNLDKCPDTPKGVKVDANGCPLDTDGDGVPDYLDKCPGTPKGPVVNNMGCWVLENVRFDFNKSNIKPEYYSELIQVAIVLQDNPSVAVEIQGHTDDIGTASYNKKLSKQRADSVMNYLVNMGIDKKRLSTKGYGFTRPIASNLTKRGRAMNRRVELTPIP